jgi:hypothetical protein
MNSTEYYVYKPEELYTCLNSITEENEEVKNFFSTFSFTNILNQNIDKGNSAYVLKNVMKEDTTKSKIIFALNKLHQQNLPKIISMIREITFQTEDELIELVNQCIQKIKRDNEQIKPLVATLCWELLSTYFSTATGEKIYFRKLLLTAVKNDYVENTNFNDENWTKEKGEKTMILIGTLFNNKIIEEKVMTSIISDFKKKILYNENAIADDFLNVDKSINLLSCLISTIIKTIETKPVFDNLDIFLENQMTIYEEKKCISKKIRLVCKNCIEELRESINTL